GELRVGHDGGGVRVDEDDAVALLTERLTRLGAGVVELAGLADHDRARADEEDGADVGAAGHQRSVSAADRLTTAVSSCFTFLRSYAARSLPLLRWRKERRERA